jgi:hypothetical protein
MTDASICPRTPADKTSHTSADKPFPSLLTLLLRSRTKLLIVTSRGHPRTPADLLHLPPICLALFGGSPFGTAKPCSSAICPELCIVRQRRQASKKLLGRHYLFSIWAIAATHTCRWYHTATTNPKKTQKNMHYLQNIPKNNVFEKS